MTALAPPLTVPPPRPAAFVEDADAPSQAFEIQAFDAPLGAEVLGLDLARPLIAGRRAHS